MALPHDSAEPAASEHAGCAGVRVVVALVLAALVTAGAVRAAVRGGFFEALPGAERAAWLAAGARWAEALRTGGVAGVLAEYAAAPPGAVYPVAAGAAGFTLFGFHDWAPHAAGFALVLGYLLAADLAVRGARLGARVAALVFAATVPLAGLAAGEPRGALAAGLCVAAGSLLVLRGALGGAGARRMLGAGALFGAAFVCDASAGPIAALMLAASLALGTGADLLGGGVRWGGVARAWAMCVSAAIVVALPHAIVLWNDAPGLGEAVRAARGEAWGEGTSTRERVRWYLNGPAGALVLGPQLYLLVLPLGAAASLYVHRWRRGELARVGAVGAALALGYLVLLLSPERSLVGGAFFQVMLVLSGLAALGRVLALTRGRAGRWAGVLAGVMAVGGVVLFRWSALPAGSAEGATRAGVEAAYRAVREGAGYGVDRVLVVDGVPGCADVLRYWTIRDGAGLTVGAIGAERDGAALEAALDGADFIVAPAGAAAGSVLRAALARRGDFEPVGGGAAAGRGLAVLRSVGPFAGFEVVSGMRVAEGPHPQWDLPLVRWGEGPRSVLRVRAEEGGTLRVFALCRVFRYNQVLTVLVDGREAGVFPLEGGAWRPVSVRVPVEAGERTVELVYSVWDDEPGERPNAVLYRTLRTLIER